MAQGAPVVDFDRANRTGVSAMVKDSDEAAGDGGAGRANRFVALSDNSAETGLQAIDLGADHASDHASRPVGRPRRWRRATGRASIPTARRGPGPGTARADRPGWIPRR